MNKRFKAQRLEDIEGYEIYNMRVTSPNTWIVDHRSTIACFYRVLDAPDGSLWMFNSSIGNEEITEKCKKQKAKEVFANHIMGGLRVTPYDGGVDLINTACTDPNGLIPDVVKTIVAKRQANNAMYLADYLINGTIPEQI